MDPVTLIIGGVVGLWVLGAVFGGGEKASSSSSTGGAPSTNSTPPVRHESRARERMVIVYHPGYIPGRSEPVPREVVSFLDGEPAECRELSSRFAREEVDYFEVGRFSDMAQAREFIARKGLREL